jgi:hypothetical protein
MWIKWRYYERKGVGSRDGEKKYKVQPIVMHSFRFKKSLTMKALQENFHLKRDVAEEVYNREKKKTRMPRQKQLQRFPAFLSCDYVHLYDPAHISRAE